MFALASQLHDVQLVHHQRFVFFVRFLVFRFVVSGSQKGGTGLGCGQGRGFRAAQGQPFAAQRGRGLRFFLRLRFLAHSGLLGRFSLLGVRFPARCRFVRHSRFLGFLRRLLRFFLRLRFLAHSGLLVRFSLLGVRFPVRCRLVRHSRFLGFLRLFQPGARYVHVFQFVHGLSSFPAYVPGAV